MKRRSIILAIALVIILLGGILSVAVDNDFGRICGYPDARRLPI